MIWPTTLFLHHDRDTNQPPIKSRNAPRPHFTLKDRLRSGYHRVWYEATQALRWSQRPFRPGSEGPLTNLTPSQYGRIEWLATTYHVRFEETFSPETALLNYAYLDVLDRARHAFDWTVSVNQRVCDLGSANFVYAAALHAFFHPAQLVGVEVDGHRLYCNGRSRIDYARGHIQELPHTEYVTADYCHYIRPADLITAWYPFVTPKPLRAWRLPLSLFNHGALFARVANNLLLGGQFIMINHNSNEAEVARGIAEDVGLVCTGHYVHEIPLRSRIENPVLTLWHHS